MYSLGQTLVKLVFVGLTIGHSLDQTAWAGCSKVDKESFLKVIKAKGIKRLVFFASWCSSCAQHLDQHRLDAAWVASFDSQERAEAVLAHMKKSGHTPECFWDSDDSIAKHFEVKSLPALKLLGS